MRQSSLKVYVLKTNPEMVWSSRQSAELDGFKLKDLERFDSNTEYQRYCELLLLLRAGEIRDLVCHPKFTLSERFKLHYSPDFTYLRRFDMDRYTGTTPEKLLQYPEFAFVDNQLWERVAEDVKGVSRKKLTKGYAPVHLLHEKHTYIHAWFQELYPKYKFELYPPLD